MQTVRIQMLGNYLIYVDERQVENPVQKSPKGAALVAFLLLNGGKPVPNQRILRQLWTNYTVNNPENALKTLVSRTRTMLNGICEGLGDCIISERGAYRWNETEYIRSDITELNALLVSLSGDLDDDTRRAQSQRLIELYQGDLYQTGLLDGEAALSEALHAQYLAAVYAYIELLTRQEEYNEISAVCRAALEIDAFDDRLHIELMKAMVNLNRTNDAMRQYRHASSINQRYLGAEPSAELQNYYRQLNSMRKTLKFNLDAIRNELYESASESGAFVCDDPLFREIYNLQIRNLERLGTTMCLGIIMVGDAEDGMDSGTQDAVMKGLLEILRTHLRKGDIITRYAPSIVAVLLPTVNYQTGDIVMERIQMLFYKQFSESSIPFHYRLGMLGDASKTAREPD